MMSESITFQELQDSFTHLRSLDGVDELGYHLALIYPYDIFPGSFPGGIHQLITRENWEAYQWNPPDASP